MNYPYFNNYMQMPSNAPTSPYTAFSAPKHEIIRVNGKNGAEALQMAPNSSIFVADETNANRIWLCMTDGAGFKTVRAIRCVFEDVIEQEQANTQLASFEERLAKLEGIVNDKFNPRSTKSGKNSAESGTD